VFAIYGDGKIMKYPLVLTFRTEDLTPNQGLLHLLYVYMNLALGCCVFYPCGDWGKE
jgi:hypothetical protein